VTTAKTDQVHRLHEMITEEVSMVDRAANRRKFLIVKREGDAMPTGAAVTAGPNGLTTTPAGGAGATTTPAADAQPTTKAGATLTKDAQKALADCMDEVLSQLEDAQKLIDGAKIVDDETQMDAGPIVEAMMGAAEMCEDACYATTGQQEPPAEEAGEGAAAPPQQPNQPGPPLTMGFGKRLAVLQAKRVINKAANAALLRESLAKYGSKMKKERLVRFQQAIDILSSLLGEVVPPAPVDTSKAKGAPAAADDPKKKKPVPATPTGPSADNTPPGAMAPNKGKTGKADDAEIPAAVAKQLTDLQAQVAGLTQQIKKNAESTAAARDAVASSNAAPVEGAPRVVSDVSWPLDMNDSIEDEKSPNRFG